MAATRSKPKRPTSPQLSAPTITSAQATQSRVVNTVELDGETLCVPSTCMGCSKAILNEHQCGDVAALEASSHHPASRRG